MGQAGPVGEPAERGESGPPGMRGMSRILAQIKASLNILLYL